MKRISIMLSLVMILSLILPCYGFAETSAEPICSVEELKEEVNRLSDDGTLSDTERRYLEENTDEAIVAEFLSEKMDEAVDLINDESVDNEVTSLENGDEYKKEIYDLGDGCQLIVELEDRADGKDNTVSSRASGSNTLWKGYGNRYFTASATVIFSLGDATLRLRNYYTLSSKGIDERKGEAGYAFSTDDGNISVTEPVITDSTARTVGESDVNMYCNFTLNYSEEDGYPIKKKYKMKSNVGFVDIDKTAEKVKVKQSWSLTRI